MDIAALMKTFGGDAVMVDLTHPLTPNMPVWPTHPYFCQEVIESYDQGDRACNHSLGMSEHTGTHFDAPLHFIRGAAGIDAISLQTFFGRMATIDARDCASGEAVSIERIKAFEIQHGPIQAGDAVFFHFGWDRFWDDPQDHPRFLNDWPGLSRPACEYLLERGIRIAGSDCLSLDCFGSSDFPAHNLLLGAGVLIGENFARLGELPAFSFLVTLPLPIAGGSGSPLRAVAVFASAGQSNTIAAKA
ncbi:cyclase family protein [Neorhizobium sp. NCHU2750]|uniref:cyclase family protein n=1 Tax=Neorhizobium sp. NCHU2750 TaxID=1825976 RepID=UPI000E70A454|nr:metal-dependent hydrolase [Neorhizobium sp. NCHU2750]